MSKIGIWWRKQRFKLLTIGVCVYLILLVGVLLVWAFSPQQEGMFALVEIFLPYLFLPLVFMVPFLFWRFTVLLRIIFVLGVILFGVCFPPRLGDRGSANGSVGEVTALTWNMLGSNERSGYVRQLLNSKEPGIVVLQETEWEGIDLADDILRQYPYHVYRPREGAPPGEVILSKYPIKEYGVIQADSTRVIWDIPRVLWVRLDVGQGRTLLVVNAHPISAYRTVYGCIFCPERRDRQITALHEFLQPLITRGEQILLLGDMNTTDREPAYRELSANLKDTHLLVGNGNGHSWGIMGLNRYWSLLRIDYIFVTPNIRPLSLDTDCSSRGSDHCVLMGHFAL
ncbi:MAG: endonuclease/exonuclease/phosphatase family protein [Ktedonobacteraceae bacterium]|nr:endonuclease/exonuclease/phosphatase family protein [Ktedonobacteraceae bacterium]MBO0791952.1 endonuclease/exonuclease/phosphatase family protein [Ktedonobacteraceae bacterium]